MRQFIKILIYSLFFTSFLYSQTNVIKFNDIDFPKFTPSILNFYSYNNKQNRIDVFIQIPYKNLRFVKEGSLFSASYEISIIISDFKNIIYDRSFLKKLSTENFDLTTSLQTYDLTQKSFDLKPGKYSVEIIVTDEDSKKSYKTRQNIEVRNFDDDKINISDLLFVSKINEKDGKLKIIPNISNNIGNLNDTFYVFYEVYSPVIINDSLEFEYSIYDKEEDVVLSGKSSSFISDNTTQVIIPINKKDLIFGKYRLYIEVKSQKYKNFISKKLIGKDFLIKWQDLPISINDLDLAIKQTSYIASSNEMDSLTSAKDQNEKLKRFLSFWKNRTPSMEEYFARVDYANEKFKTHREGWKTDMGMVFIIFGVPDNIDRHPFELGDPPYEIWDYYAINRRFIFVDESGFGEYRSVYPIWDDRVRIR